jgi:predicted kinase
MSIPLLVIVSGPPASGKTTLARRFATELSLPLINKDGIKESLFDSLGWQDRAWSRKLGAATYHLLYYFLEATLAAGVSLIVESNFAPLATPELKRIQEKYPFRPFQVMCWADGETLVERYSARSGQRHPGHVDFEALAEIEPVLRRGRLEPLGFDGEIIELDTTDFSKIDVAGTIARLKTALEDSKK